MFKELYKKVARRHGDEHELGQVMRPRESVGEANKASSAETIPETAPAASKDQQHPAIPQTIGLTKEDKIIGPNAPVGDAQEELPTRPPSSHSSTGDGQQTQDKQNVQRKSQEKEGTTTQEESEDQAGQANGLPIENKDSDTAENTVDEQNDDSKYPGGTTLIILTFGLCMAMFVVALDNTIIATAIPHITTVFDSLNDVGWYGSSYLLTTTSLQPSFGKVYTYFNVKWTYLCALVIFELGSVICAAATSSVMLIVGRAVAGAGAAALFSGGMTIIGYSVALRRRAIYIALLSSMFGISSVIGPILGGVLTDRATWRWCFWINLPFGGVALLTVFFFFKNPERKQTDMTGYDSSPNYVTAYHSSLNYLLSLPGHGPLHIYYIPFYFQAVKGTTAEGSGIRTIPYLVSTTIASVVIGGAITTFGWYTPFMWFGAAIFTVGSGMLYTLRVADYAGYWIGWQLIAGIGSGCAVQIPFIAVQVVLPAKDMPTGNALAIFFNSLGGSISISIAQNIFSNTLVKQLPIQAPGVNPAVIIGAGATHVREVTPPEKLGGVLQAYDMAVTRALILPIAVGGLAFIASLFMEMKSVKGKKLVAAAGGA
ncbi:MAG: hypothetical protein Q9191_001117 [Dirinaria sp. TL-2023a]